MKKEQERNCGLKSDKESKLASKKWKWKAAERHVERREECEDQEEGMWENT
jgi:hypothetical protein